MKRLIITIFALFFSTLIINGQDALDTIYFVDGKVEAVQLSGLTETAVQYNYYGEGIPINTPKTRIEKVITRAGRMIVFENTAKKKMVYSCEDWEKVEISNIESEVEGMIRYANVSGKAKAGTSFSSLDKMQNRAMTKMRMQTAFIGCDVVYILNQTNTDARTGSFAGSAQTASSTLSGTAYATKTINPFDIENGNYVLWKVYRLQPNDMELNQISFEKYSKHLTIDKNKFFKDEDYYSINFDSKIPDSGNKMSLLKVTDDGLVFLVIDRSKQSKIKYYNLFYRKKK